MIEFNLFSLLVELMFDIVAVIVYIKHMYRGKKNSKEKKTYTLRKDFYIEKKNLI